MLPSPMRPTRAFLWLLAALVVMVVLFTTMALTARERSRSSVLENVVATTLHPFQTATGWVVRTVRGTAESVQEMLALRAENARLRGELTELHHLRVMNGILADENQVLRAELALRRDTPYRLVAAEVIGRNADHWFETVVINRGGRDGVRPKMAVINHQGLVGLVHRVTYTQATVQLLVDRDFFLAVKDAGSGEFGALHGQGMNNIIVEFTYNPEARIETGAAIVTSGLGDMVPGNLFVGTVETVGLRENNLVKYAQVRPGADFSRLGVVQVVLVDREPLATGSEEDAQ